MNCKNCGQSVDGNFCTSCGQSTKVNRINLPNFLSLLSNDVFQINKGLFYTLKELSVRPGHSIRDYLLGKRKKYFPPIAYTILMLLPVYSLASYLAFLRSGFNYLEHFILNAYVVGQLAIFHSTSSLLGLVARNNDFWVLITVGISIAYTFWVFWQFFSEKSRVGVLLRSILTYLLNLIFLLMIILIVFRLLSIGM
jgi:hypothetical protein